MTSGCMKIGYPDKKAARQALTRIRTRRSTTKTPGRRRPSNPPLRIYQCPDCHQWHLTTVTPTPHRQRDTR